MLTKKEKRAARKACKVVGWLDRAMNDLCDDPMTAAMGVPVGDFYEDWSRRYRGMLADRMKDPDNPERIKRLLWEEYEQFLP